MTQFVQDRVQRATVAAQTPPATTTPRELFRREAIEFQQTSRDWGRVVPLQPLPTRAAVWILVVGIGGAIAISTVAQYAQKAVAQGYLRPENRSVRVYAPQVGTITNVAVAEGDHVRESQPLFTVATNQVTPGGDDVNAVVLSELRAHIDDLKQQIAVEGQRAEAEDRRLQGQVNTLMTEITAIGREVPLQQQRQTLAEDIVRSGAALLEKGLVSQIEQKRRVDYVLEQTSKLQTLAQQLAAKQGQLLNARAQLEQAPMAAQERVRSLRTDLNSTEQKIAEVSGRSAALVRSPIAGEVALLTASVGQTTDPKRLEAEIVPEGTRLLAEVFVTPQASGLVQSGQQVRIRFDAFPHAYGTFGGVVQQVSHTPLTSEDHLVTPIPIKDTVYRVVIRLDKDVIIEDGKTRKLSPGMLVHADIILERRTIAGWIANMIRGLRWTV